MSPLGPGYGRAHDRCETDVVKPLRVAVVEDQELYRSMLTALIGAHPTTAVVVSVAGSSEARARIVPGTADIAILDVELNDGNGVALGVALRRRDPNLAILLLSAHDVMDLVLRLPADVAGSWSYLSKSSSLTMETLIRTLWATAQGQVVLDPELIDVSRARRGSELARLTDRQMEVLRLVAQGMSNQSVAESLHLSVRSVEGHLKLIYETLGISAATTLNARVVATLAFLRDTSRTG